MISEASRATVQKARLIYEKLREKLEQESRDQFVCIEPTSGQYFLGSTFDDAVNAAINAYPDRLSHTLRIGHSAALHLGVMVQ